MCGRGAEKWKKMRRQNGRRWRRQIKIKKRERDDKGRYKWIIGKPRKRKGKIKKTK